jgi:hypothetical protein
MMPSLIGAFIDSIFIGEENDSDNKTEIQTALILTAFFEFAILIL